MLLQRAHLMLQLLVLLNNLEQRLGRTASNLLRLPTSGRRRVSVTESSESIGGGATSRGSGRGRECITIPRLRLHCPIEKVGEFFVVRGKHSASRKSSRRAATNYV